MPKIGKNQCNNNNSSSINNNNTGKKDYLLDMIRFYLSQGLFFDPAIKTKGKRINGTGKCVIYMYNKGH